VVHDIPLLVEAGYAPDYHLVLIVDADEETRVQRLLGCGLEKSDARSRIRAQATRQQRVEAADVWLDNGGSVDDLTARVDQVWERLVEFEGNLRSKTAASTVPAVSEHDPDWTNQAARLATRLRKAAGERALSVDHVGFTAVPGLRARGVLDLQLAVASIEDADALAEPLANAGFPLVPEIRSDDSDDPQWEKRQHAHADPGRPVAVHLRVAGRANWRRALLLRDWLTADAAARAERAQQADQDPAGQSWLTDSRAEQWATGTGWKVPEL
jgi:dephospho-CoA kinase